MDRQEGRGGGGGMAWGREGARGKLGDCAVVTRTTNVNAVNTAHYKMGTLEDIFSL